jgi:chromosome segregation ATPase
MLKKLMSKNLNIFSILSGGISVFGVLIAFDDKKLKDNYIKLKNRKELLEKQVNELKIDELKNDLTKTKVEYYRKSLEETKNKITNELETIQKLEIKTNEQKEILNSHLDNLNSENEKMQNMISDIVKYFNDNNNKFIGDNIIEFFTNYIDNWNKMLSTLSF